MTKGDRVKLIAPSPLLTLRSPFGTIIGDSEWGGYVAVRMDEPAISHCGWRDGHRVDEDLIEVTEHPDNMELA